MNQRTFFTLALLFFLLLAAGLVLAQNGYDLGWWTADGDGRANG